VRDPGALHRRDMPRSPLVVLALAAVGCKSAPAPAVWIDDDYEAARLQAARSKLPLAVEVWAPW